MSLEYNILNIISVLKLLNFYIDCFNDSVFFFFFSEG